MKKKAYYRSRFTYLFKRSIVRLLLIELILALLTAVVNQNDRSIRVKRIMLLQIDGLEITSKPR